MSPRSESHRHDDRDRAVPARRPSTNSKSLPNAGLMLGQRLRRWPNGEPELGKCLVRVTDVITSCHHPHFMTR